MSTITKLITAEELLQLPDDGKKYELVRGELIEMTPPGLRHGNVQGRIYYFLLQFLLNHPIGTPFIESGAITERDPDTVRGPDVSYYSSERLSLNSIPIGYHTQSPELCAEVLSPSNTKRDIATKILEYFAADVRMVWVVDPAHKRCCSLSQCHRCHLA